MVEMVDSSVEDDVMIKLLCTKLRTVHERYLIQTKVVSIQSNGNIWVLIYIDSSSRSSDI